MTMRVQTQPPLIFRSIPGLINFWYNGIRAARAHMTYAACAVRAGHDLDHFVQMANTQVCFLDYIDREIYALVKGPLCPLHASPADEFLLDFIRATNMLRDAQFLRDIEQRLCALPTSRQRVVNRYRTTPSLRDTVLDIAHGNVSRFGGKRIMVEVCGGSDTYVRNPQTQARVRRAFDRLFEIGVLAINPDSKNRTIQIFFNRGAIEFVFSGVSGGTALANAVSNDASLRELGWKHDLRSDRDAVAKVMLYPRRGACGRFYAKSEDGVILSMGDITQGAEVLMKPAPFAFYAPVFVGNYTMLDVSASPLYRLILSALETTSDLQTHKLFRPFVPRPL